MGNTVAAVEDADSWLTGSRYDDVEYIHGWEEDSHGMRYKYATFNIAEFYALIIQYLDLDCTSKLLVISLLYRVTVNHTSSIS
jgi:hypothetical protein